MNNVEQKIGHADVGRYEYPCTFPDGEVKDVLYKDIKRHNRDIIEDNVLWGMKYPDTYSAKEIHEYEAGAVHEQKQFMKTLRENQGMPIIFDLTTESFRLEPYKTGDGK